MTRQAPALAGQLDLLALLDADQERHWPPDPAQGWTGPGPAGSTVTVPAPPVVDVLHLARHTLWGWKLTWALHSPTQRRALLGQLHGSGGTCDTCGYWEHDARIAECAMRTWTPPGVQPVRATIAALLRLADQHAAARPDVVRELHKEQGFLPGAAWVADRFWAPLDLLAAGYACPTPGGAT